MIKFIKSILDFSKNYSAINGYYITNRRLLIGSFLGFVGALIIAMDKFPIVHNLIDHCPPWNDIAFAIHDLDTYDYPQADGRNAGFLSARDRGFGILVKIIKQNRPEIHENIIGIGQNSPISVAEIDNKIIHIALENNKQGVPITTDFIFREWISRYRERIFLRIGLTFVTFAFLLGVVGRVEKKTI